ncbi:hypothetical protein HYX16_03425 [Candidatus Woesearchaeota archaeon]|nr:hypothetical protein [Candidatus Woesearchaeota archaeon]
MGTFVYELPREKEKLSEMIDLIPSDWAWIDAHLFATREHYKSGRVVEKIRIHYHGKKTGPGLYGTDDRPFEEEEIIRERKFKCFEEIKAVNGALSSVYMDKLGIDKSFFSIDGAKQLIKGFLENGYKGEIEAVKRTQPEENLNNICERFKISHFSGFILIDWLGCFDGKKENLEELIEKLEKAGIKRQVPLLS